MTAKPINESSDADMLAHIDRTNTHDAIAQGIDDMKAGRGKPVAEADTYLREKLGFRPRELPYECRGPAIDDD